MINSINSAFITTNPADHSFLKQNQLNALRCPTFPLLLKRTRSIHRHQCPFIIAKFQTSENSSEWQSSPFKPHQQVRGYEILSILGRGNSSITYEALPTDSLSYPVTDRLALKALSLKGMQNWKAYELFQRETKTLRSLSHPAIPEFIDSFEIDTETDTIFVLVQRKAAGRSLQDIVDDGYRFTTDKVLHVFMQLMEVLQYLSSLNPTIIHRDVKPANVLLDLSVSRNEPTVSLVDFGGVNAARISQGGILSTMVGTFGYMAPEQFAGGIDVRSDLYSAAVTILFMLTATPPSSLPQKRLRLDIESVISPPERIKLGRVYTVMQRLLEPAPEDRYDSATDVLIALRDTRGGSMELSSATLTREEVVSLQESLSTLQSPDTITPRNPLEMISGWTRRIRRRKPAGSRVILERDRSNRIMRVQIPPKGLTNDAVSRGAFTFAWTGFTAIWTVGVLTGGAPLLSLFSIPFWAASARLAKSTLNEVSGSRTLLISFGSGEKQVYYFGLTSKNILGSDTVVEGDARDVDRAAIETSMIVNGTPITELVISEGTRRHSFGAELEPVEQEWLRDEINDFISTQPMYR